MATSHVAANADLKLACFRADEAGKDLFIVYASIGQFASFFAMVL